MRRQLPVIVVLLLFIWLVLTIRLSVPWYGNQDAPRVWIPAAVRNYDIYGTENIGLMVTRNTAPTQDLEAIAYYSHHPPLVAWLPAALTKATGFHELGVRFVFAAATMLSVSGFYVFVRRLYNHRLALAAAFLFFVTPMTSYFQRVPGHDSVGFVAIMLFAAVLVNWLRHPTRARLVALLSLSWLAVWTAWPAAIFIGTLGVAAMFLGNRQQRIGVVLMGAVSVLAFVAMMLLYESMWSNSWESLLDAYVWRTSAASEFPDSEPFTALGWVVMNIAHLLLFTSPTFVALALIGVQPTIKHGNRTRIVLVAALFGAAMIYLLVFRNASYIHNYYKAFLVPAMAITAAAAWHHRKRFRSRWMKPLIEVLAAVTVVWCAVLLIMLHMTGQQPTIDAIIDFVDADVPPIEYVSVDFQQYGEYSGFKEVIQFYSQRPIGWNQSYDEALSEAAEVGLPLRYIYCPFGEDAQLPEPLQTMTGTPFGDDRCVAYLVE